MHTLAVNPPTTTIYSCDRGGIHLVIQNVNIGMYAIEFCDLNRQVQHAWTRIESGIWPSPYLSLTYSSTVVCLSLSDLPPIVEAMQEAAEAIEQMLELGNFDTIADVHCQPKRPQIASFPDPNQQIDGVEPHNLN